MLNVNFKGTERTKISINGDENTIIELNLNDTGIIGRMNAAMPRIEEVAQKYKEVEMSEDSEEAFYQIADMLKTLDEQIKTEINYIFDFDVCGVILAEMSAMSLTADGFVFNEIIKKLSALYADNISENLKSLNANVKKNLSKYSKTKKK